MKVAKPFFALAIVFFAIGALKLVNDGGSAGAFIALGAAFLAIGASRNKPGKGDENAG
jgi:hypothetical protein